MNNCKNVYQNYIMTKRSVHKKQNELVSFYCVNCHNIHTNYIAKNIQCLDDKILFCEESFKERIKTFIK